MSLLLTFGCRASGVQGAGGKYCWADPATGISMAFVTNTWDSPAELRTVEISTLANRCAPASPPPSSKYEPRL